jgi:type II secretory pathway pseudopilin PulG
MFSRAGQRLRDDRGSFLIETVISAVVVALVGTAVLAGVDGAVSTAGRNRARSIEAGLAEQDQERMRSFQAAQLNNYHQTRTVTVAGIAYSVASRSDWIRDNSGTVSCTNDSTQASYMRIASTVTPLGSRPGPPVTQTSLIAPTNGTFTTSQGSLAVAIIDRNGVAGPTCPSTSAATESP